MDDRRWPTYKPRNLTLDAYVPRAPESRAGGFRVRDDQGRVYLDAINGIGCVPLGHGDPGWTAALAEQAGRLVASAGPFWTEPQQALVQAVTSRVPIRDARAFLGNTGTEVTEGAIKLATRATGRDVIVACERAFHGRTLGALSLTANPAYRDPYVHVLGESSDRPRFATMNVAHVPYGDLRAIEQVLDTYAGRVAMVCLEPIQGEGGFYPASREYLVGVREACRADGALLGLDEIQCGSGRTGNFSAWTTLVGDDPNLDVDIAWYAKALGNGFPVSVCVARGDLAEHMTKGSHGSTFGGNPLACAAGVATLRAFDERGFLAAAAKQLPTLRAIAEADPDPRVLEVRGSGAMIGIDLGDGDLAAAVSGKMQDLGVLVLTCGVTAIRSLLPYHAAEAELTELWTTLRRAIAEVTGA